MSSTEKLQIFISVKNVEILDSIISILIFIITFVLQLCKKPFEKF